jgi:FOG: Ankyrin repeat
MLKIGPLLDDMSSGTESPQSGSTFGSRCIDLFVAIYDNDFECMEKLLGGGANPNFANEDYETPLHYATYKGRLDMVELLIKYKADVNVRDKYGMTPLHVAARFGYTQIAKALLENGAGAYLNDADAFGLTT